MASRGEPLALQDGSYFESSCSPYLKNKHTDKRTEVFFRYVFTSVFPHKSAGDRDHDKHFVMPIRRLTHITHNTQADAIMNEDPDKNYYTFNAMRKLGKEYVWDGSPMGESFRDDFLTPNSQVFTLPSVDQKYKKIGLKDTTEKPKESLMPEGCYSWWGVPFDDNYILPHCNADRLNIYRSGDSDCPFYLRNPPSSPYGNQKFSGGLHEILMSYCTSRKTSGKRPDAYLLRGGTLRYVHEICYVIIVCTEEDKSSSALTEYPPMPHEGVVKLNGLVDENGKVSIDERIIPNLSVSFLSKAGSWENLAFAFYFPEESSSLMCPRDNIEQSVIDHNTCVKTIPPGNRQHWVCPNAIRK